MLTVATILGPSTIHGLGCYTVRQIPRGVPVWMLELRVDRLVFDPRQFDEWERDHCYKSHVQASTWVLPRDNGAFLNFAAEPCLTEGHIINGEPCLIAARDIEAGEELTVSLDTDAEASLKLPNADWRVPIFNTVVVPDGVLPKGVCGFIVGDPLFAKPLSIEEGA